MINLTIPYRIDSYQRTHVAVKVEKQTTRQDKILYEETTSVNFFFLYLLTILNQIILLELKRLPEKWY